MDELRSLWQAIGEKVGSEDVGKDAMDMEDTVSDRISTYFEWEKTKES